MWERLHHRLLVWLGDAGQLDWSRASIDAVSVRARHRGVDRRESGRPRQARLQVSPAGRWQGIPLAVALSAANPHDSTLLEQLVDAVPAVIGPRGRRGRPRRRLAKLHADKAYDSKPLREDLRRRSITLPRAWCDGPGLA